MSRKEIISLVILILVVGVGAYRYFNRSFTETKSKYLLDTIVEVSATSQSKMINRQIDSVFAYIEKLEAKLDEYDSNSLVSKINESSRTSFPMDPDIYQMLIIADSLYTLTEGSFDVTIKPVFDLWGFSSETPAVPDSNLIKDEMKKVGFKKLRFDSHRLYKPTGMKLSFGAIAKGFILDKARDYMLSLGLNKGYINCRSSMTFYGNSIPQIVYIQHPRKADDSIASFKINNTSVGTSGDYQQFFEIDGIRYHHILDAKTGYPVSNMYSVTVVNPSAAWADGYSTALFLMDPNTVIQKTKAIKDFNAVIYYDQDGSPVSLKTLGMKDLELSEKL